MKIQELYGVHRRKIIWSAPIIFLFLVGGAGFIGTGNIALLKTERSAFPSVNERSSVRFDISTKVAVNAVGATITFPPDMLAIDSISRTSSVIDLWAEEPSFSNTEGTLRFSGGIVNAGRDNGNQGNILVVNFRTLKPGKAPIGLKEVELLANNGEGTNVVSSITGTTLYIHDAGKASHDVNSDGIFSIADINSLYFKTFGVYDPRFDINSDKRINWDDVLLLIGLL